MILIGEKNGIVTMEMTKNDATEIAKMIGSMEEAAIPFLESWAVEVQATLPNALWEIVNEESPDFVMEEPEYYLNTKTDTLFVTYYSSNRPSGLYWVKISKKMYEAIRRGFE